MKENELLNVFLDRGSMLINGVLALMNGKCAHY